MPSDTYPKKKLKCGKSDKWKCVTGRNKKLSTFKRNDKDQVKTT